MWYTLPDSNKHYPLTIETVRKIKAMNQNGQRPEELETAEISSISGKPKEVEPQFVDVVGKISIRSLERNAQKRKGQSNKQQQGNRDRGRGNNQTQSSRDKRQGSRPTIQKKDTPSN
jgi:hypothetical protein